jgi:Arc/MetJ-type ribon-helix-helix transcriptional regulator
LNIDSTHKSIGFESISPMVTEKTADSVITVSIPSDLVERLRKKLSRMEFESLSDCVIYALEQVITDTSVSEKDTKEDIFSDQDKQLLEKRLKDLGYA